MPAKPAASGPVEADLRLSGAVWFPDWPLYAVANHYHISPLEPTIVTHRARVVHANRAAVQAGVRNAMRSRQAIALLPEQSHIFELGNIGDIIVDQMEDVIARVGEYAADITIVRPGLLLVNISAIEKYFGSSVMLLDSAALPGLDVVLGVAPTDHGAILAARAGRDIRSHREFHAFMDTLSIADLGAEKSLGINAEMLQLMLDLGLRTLGDVRGLGSHAVISRFGGHGSVLMDLLNGTVRAIHHHAELLPEEPIYESQELDEPVATVDEVVFIAQALAVRIQEQMRRLGLLAREIRIELFSPDGQSRQRVWRTWDMIDEATIARLIRWQVHSWKQAVSKLAITVTDVAKPSNLALPGIEDAGVHPDGEVISRLAQFHMLIPYPTANRGASGRVQLLPYGMSAEQPADSMGAIPAPHPGSVFNPPQAAAIRGAHGQPAYIQANLEWNTPPQILEFKGKQWRIDKVLGPWPEKARWWDRQNAHPTARIQVIAGDKAWLAQWSNGSWCLEGQY
ncbi:MAG: DNA polymerase Y family protein [Corynebacterium sp.]|nr:DNA polymerase Y family protein [Corynebacterium sp.]